MMKESGSAAIAVKSFVDMFKKLQGSSRIRNAVMFIVIDIVSRKLELIWNTFDCFRRSNPVGECINDLWSPVGHIAVWERGRGQPESGERL